MSNAPPATRKIYSISELNRSSKSLLEKHFGLVWVEGEISNLSIPQSGHWYFTLKDDQAQISCAFFKGKNRFVKPVPENGDKVLIRTKVSLFEARGNYQLIVEYLEAAGVGALQRQFEQLKTKLKLEGLFDEQHKKPIPEVIKTIGVITSTSGAAIQDILSIIKRRYPIVEIIIYPVMVQGDKAQLSLMDAITIANQRNEVDVLLLTRGGGSLEDMWCFNDEALATAIYQSELPIVSAIGHEIDFTISDFVADLRAATPSAAAELLTPDGEKIQQEILYLENKLEKIIKTKLEGLQQKLDWLSARLINPAQALQQKKTAVIALLYRLNLSMKNSLNKTQQQLSSLTKNLQLSSPQSAIENSTQVIQQFYLRLQQAQQHILQQKENTLRIQSQELNALSPLATLDRGYSITQLAEGQLITAASVLRKGTKLKTRLSGKHVFSSVDSVEDI